MIIKHTFFLRHLTWMKAKIKENPYIITTCSHIPIVIAITTENIFRISATWTETKKFFKYLKFVRVTCRWLIQSTAKKIFLETRSISCQRLENHAKENNDPRCRRRFDEKDRSIERRNGRARARCFVRASSVKCPLMKSGPESLAIVCAVGRKCQLNEKHGSIGERASYTSTIVPREGDVCMYTSSDQVRQSWTSTICLNLNCLVGDNASCRAKSTDFLEFVKKNHGCA